MSGVSNAVKVKARKSVMGVVNPDHAVELHGEEFQNILIQLYGFLENRGLDYEVSLLPPRPMGPGSKPKGPALLPQPQQPMYRNPWDNPIQPGPWDNERYRMMAPESRVQGATVMPGTSDMGRTVPPEIQFDVVTMKDNKYRYPESKGLRLNHAGDWFLIPEELVEMGVSVFFGPLGMMANNYMLSGDRIRDTATEMNADKHGEYGICRVDYVDGMSFQVAPTSISTDYEVGIAYPTAVFGKGDFDQSAVERLLSLMRGYVQDHFMYLTTSYMQNLMQQAKFRTTNGIPHDLATNYSRLADNYYVRNMACGTQRETIHVGYIKMDGQRILVTTSAFYPFTIDPSVEAFVIANLPYIMYTGSNNDLMVTKPRYK